MAVRDEKLKELALRMERLGIKPSDLEEKFIIGSGSGGQKRHKTHSCVYLKHLPTGIEVKCQKERFREINRFLARRQLCDLIEAKDSPTPTAQELKAEKIRKQKKRRARRQKPAEEESV